MTSIPSKYNTACKVCKTEIAQGDIVHAIKQEGTDKARWCKNPECGPLQKSGDVITPEASKPEITDQQKANLQEHYNAMAAKTADALTDAEAKLLDLQVRKMHAMNVQIKQTLTALGVECNPAQAGMYLRPYA